MTKQVEAVYEQGRLRPLEPLELPEGARLRVVLITEEAPGGRRAPAEVMSEIAALPLEGPAEPFSGREHDSVIYPQK
ncbi:MAG: antitoxin family protein [Acidobacteria bacterium]|nr:antitoxin family protein [Acidobacteriota bacterium]